MKTKQSFKLRILQAGFAVFGLSSLLISTTAFGGACPSIIAHAVQSLRSEAIGSNAEVTRQVYKLQMADGSIQYHYSLEFSPDSNSSSVGPDNIQLNGQNTKFEISHNGEGGAPQPITFADYSCGYSVEFPGRNLFVYARYGDHLNAWDIAIRASSGSAEHFRFPQVDLAKLGL